MSDSEASTPNHQNNVHYNGGFDGSTYYDPNFTADISQKMRVPEKISLLPDGMMVNNGHESRKMENNDHENWMRVPERILVLGGEKHAAGREQLPELKLETSIMGDYTQEPPIQLTAPPHTLTLNEHYYPSVDSNAATNEHKTAKKRKVTLDTPSSSMEEYENSSLSPQDNYYNSFYNTNNSVMNASGMDDTALRKQMKILSRRVAALERDNQSHHQREMVVYSFGILYFVLKGLFWLQRNW